MQCIMFPYQEPLITLLFVLIFYFSHFSHLLVGSFLYGIVSRDSSKCIINPSEKDIYAIDILCCKLNVMFHIISHVFVSFETVSLMCGT